MNMRRRKKKVPDSTDISLKADKSEARVNPKMHMPNPTVVHPKENSLILLPEIPLNAGSKESKVGQSKEKPSKGTTMPKKNIALPKPNLIRLVPNECLVDSAPKETETSVDYEVKRDSILQSTLKVI